MDMLHMITIKTFYTPATEATTFATNTEWISNFQIYSILIQIWSINFKFG